MVCIAPLSTSPNHGYSCWMATEPAPDVDPRTVARVAAILGDAREPTAPTDVDPDELIEQQADAVARTPVAYRRYLGRLAPLLRSRLTQP
jgi:hypothetical protein